MDLGWLTAGASRVQTRRLRGLLSELDGRGIRPETLQAALLAAYWSAQRSAIPSVASRHRRAQAGRVARLARLEEAITAVLDLEEPVGAELAGHLHVARALARTAAHGLPAAAPVARGRPRGWRAAAERDLRALGVRRPAARELLAAVAARAAAHPIGPEAAPLVRAALRADPAVRDQVLLRFPVPGEKTPGAKPFSSRAQAASSRP